MPHSEIRGSKGTGPSPRLIAACHVLHRLHAPRHPPNALLTLESSSISREQCFRSRVRTLCTNSAHTQYISEHSTLPGQSVLHNRIHTRTAKHRFQTWKSFPQHVVLMGTCGSHKHQTRYRHSLCQRSVFPAPSKRSQKISITLQKTQKRQAHTRSPNKAHSDGGPQRGISSPSGDDPDPRTTISSADGGPRWT